MTTLPIIPDVEISDHDKVWLNESWRIITETGKKPEYLTIRTNLKGQLPSNYKPLEINSKLVEDNSNSAVPSLLGVILANPETDLLDVGNKIVNHIRDLLNENPNNSSFQMQDLANNIGVKREKVQAVFEILKYQFHFYSSAQNLPQDQYGFESFNVNNPYTFESYISFTSFQDIITKWMEGIKNELKKSEQPRKNNKYFTKSSTAYLGTFGSKFFKSSSPDKVFVDPERFDQLLTLKSDSFDLTKLIKLCDELNVAYNFDCHYAVALLVRSIINHVPRIFGFGKFSEIIVSYNADGNIVSFRQSMTHLEESSRKIADSFAHSLVRKKEELPTETQVDFRRDLDVLLGEIVRILK